MRSCSSQSSLASFAVSIGLTTAAGVFLAATVLLSSDPGFASDPRRDISAIELPPAASNSGPTGNENTAGTCTCPGSNTPPASSSTPIDKAQREKLWPKPALADLKATLDDSDAIAALEAVQLALTEVGDGATYIWHRRHGRLSGAIQPTSSFKSASGQICRHIVMALTAGSYSRKAEGIACRQHNGVWVLEG
jgi:surface antigen